MSVPRRKAGEPQGIFGRVWVIVARIPRGQVATYGQVARLVGIPGGARTVGWAMRALPGDLRIGGRPVPWHRVVNAQGTISRRAGSSLGEEAARQAARLRREGIAVSAGGRVSLGSHLWKGERARSRGRDGGR